MIVALAGLPFGHRATATEITPQMTAFVNMGGTLADLCGDPDALMRGGPCEACRIVDALHLPDAPSRPEPAFGRPHGALPTPAEVLLHGATDCPLPPARAPPFV